MTFHPRRPEFSCDWCGKTLPSPGETHGKTNLPRGWGEVFQKDMCAECAETRLGIAKPDQPVDPVTGEVL
jgi:hypothetical protein